MLCLREGNLTASQLLSKAVDICTWNLNKKTKFLEQNRNVRIIGFRGVTSYNVVENTHVSGERAAVSFKATSTKLHGAEIQNLELYITNHSYEVGSKTDHKSAPQVYSCPNIT